MISKPAFWAQAPMYSIGMRKSNRSHGKNPGELLITKRELSGIGLHEGKAPLSFIIYSTHTSFNLRNRKV